MAIHATLIFGEGIKAVFERCKAAGSPDAMAAAEIESPVPAFSCCTGTGLIRHYSKAYN